MVYHAWSLIFPDNHDRGSRTGRSQIMIITIITIIELGYPFDQAARKLLIYPPSRLNLSVP